jgi:glycosyltransferase involved in cell wall biosynthesis
MSASLVSIVIPCYNAERWLDECLRSALAQTWHDCEVIVVDDGSTDRSLEIANRFKPQGLKVISQPNQGAAAARNTGLRSAAGSYIQFLDADDLLATDKIERQLSHPEAANPEVLLSGSWGRFTGDPDKAEFRSEILNRDYGPIEFVTVKLESHGMMHPAAWLASRLLVERAGLWDERLTLDDDGEYFSRLCVVSKAVRFCAAARSYYRSSVSGSLSRTRSERGWQSQFLSLHLTSDNLLRHENTQRIRQAVADALQRAIFDAYPRVPEERNRAAARVAELAGSAVKYEAGPRFNLVARLLGWRLAKRIRNHLV